MKKKLNKFKISIVIIIMVLAFTIAVFGRYIYNSFREAYFIAEQFYFSSDILTVNGSNYQYNNWGGTESYPIKFYLYSFESEFSKLDYDLNYTVTCSTSDSDKIKCTVNSYDEGAPTTANGTIPASTNVSSVTIYVTPLVLIGMDEEVKIQVSASTSVPYQKTISCEFTLQRETPEGVYYTVEDVINRDYAILRLTNTSDSAILTSISFDPNYLRINSNDEIYVDRDMTEGKTEFVDISGNDYVKKFVYMLPAKTSRYVKFYKVNKAQNYTYPGVQATSPITIST